MGAFIGMFIVFAMTLIINTSSKRDRILCCFICGFCLWSLLAFKDVSIGIDSANSYLPFFENTEEGIDSIFKMRAINFEPGYQIFNNVIHLLTQDPNLFLIIIATIIILPIVWFINSYSVIPTLSFFIYAGLNLYHFSFSGIRQALAISICVLAFKFLLEERKIAFFLIVALAMTFHSSAIIFAALYFLRNIKITRQRSIILLFVSILIISNLKAVLGIALNLIFTDGQYSGYANEEVDASYNLMLLYALIFILSVGFGTDTMKKRILIWGTFLLTVSQSLGLISSAGARIGFYFIPLTILAIPEIVVNLKVDQRFKSLLIFLGCAFFTFFFFYINSGGYLDVIPYKFFWSENVYQ